MATRELSKSRGYVYLSIGTAFTRSSFWSWVFNTCVKAAWSLRKILTFSTWMAGESYLEYNMDFQFCCAGWQFHFLGAIANTYASGCPWRAPSQLEKIHSEKTELGKWHQWVSSSNGWGSLQKTSDLKRERFVCDKVKYLSKTAVSTIPPWQINTPLKSTT